MITTDICSILTVQSLQCAINILKEKDKNIKSFCLIVGHGYYQHQILEIIFNVRACLDIPYEISYILPMNDWILIDSSGDNILYSSIS